MAAHVPPAEPPEATIVIGIDAQRLLGVHTRPSNRALGVLDALLRSCILAGFDAVVRRHRHHSAAREVEGLGAELSRGAPGKSAAKKHEDGGMFLPRLPAVGQINLDLLPAPAAFLCRRRFVFSVVALSCLPAVSSLA